MHIRPSRVLPRLTFCVAIAYAGGCGDPQIADLCQELMKCERGNDKDREACADQLEVSKNVAEAYGCDQRFSDWMDCLENESECVEGRYSNDGRCDDEQ